jgi:ABC-type Fe3+ transport system substrate-binding protein
MIKMVQLAFFLVLITGFSSCKIEKARPFKKQYLIIASDFLEAKDTLLFKSFKTLSGIRVRILSMSADSLLRRMKVEKQNTEIDAIIFSSTYDMVRFEKMNHLQKISNESIPKNLSKKFVSKSNKWLGIGCDPYIIVTKEDTLNKVLLYSDLTEKTKWCTNLTSASDWYPFYATIAYKINPKDKYTPLNWIKNFKKNNQGELLEIDSATNCSLFFTKHSIYMQSELYSNQLFKKGKLIFPNQQKGGSYYSMATFAVVKQARNYMNALEFIDYLMIETVNKRLNFRLKMFPLVNSKESVFRYQNNRFKKYAVSPIRLTDYFNQVKIILSILEKEKKSI